MSDDHTLSELSTSLSLSLSLCVCVCVIAVGDVSDSTQDTVASSHQPTQLQQHHQQRQRQRGAGTCYYTLLRVSHVKRRTTTVLIGACYSTTQ